MADPAWTLLVAVRFVHYAALTALFGMTLFSLYAARPSSRPPAPVGGPPRPWLALTAWSALLTTLGWFVATVAEMSGDVAAAMSPTLLWTVAREMEFGRLALARIALALIAVGLAQWGRRPLASALVSGLLLASLAGTGHARLDAGVMGLWRSLADGLHLLAAGAWIGGLVALAIVLASRRRPGDQRERAALGRLLRGFSRMGYASVAVLVATGLINGWRLVGSAANLASTAYGRLLAVKIALFLGMLALAGVNRLWISPALTDPGPGDGAWLKRLARHVAAEQVLAALVLAVVSVLGAIEPATG